MAVALLVAGCGTALPADEYGAAVQAMGRDYQDETTQLQRTLEAELPREIDLLRRRLDRDDPEAVARFADEALAITALRTRAFFAAVGDALDRYRSGLAELIPPAEIADAHHEFIAAMGTVLSGLPALLDGLESADSFDGVDRAVNASVFSDAGALLRASCLALQARLGDRGVGVDLRCPT